MTWTSVTETLSFPGRLGQVWRRSTREAPDIVRPGKPLADAPIDHLAIALGSIYALRRWWRRLTVTCGVPVAEPIHLWPPRNAKEAAADASGGVPGDDMKYRGVLRTDQGLLVLLAPHEPHDVISRFLAANGGAGLHHIAFGVDDIRAGVAALAAFPGARRITPISSDHELEQVFFKFGSDLRIIELVQRPSEFAAASTFRNIKALTSGERGDLDANPPDPVTATGR